ncbi:MAG: hypothetical protein GC131_09090 [Alphaproteobacteria bacterium]|nr:hypothetical protein [Alphaproteobacteria bacterium]
MSMHAMRRMMLRFTPLLREARTALAAKYNPDWEAQPRVPAGNPGGGQWTDGEAIVDVNGPGAENSLLDIYVDDCP